MHRSLLRRRLGVAIPLCMYLAAMYGLYAATMNESSANAPRWAIDALGDDPTAAAWAISLLREMGPPGLAAFSAAHETRLAQLRVTPACLYEVNSPERRLAQALDQIAGQRDAASAGLYWHQDLAQARLHAEREGKSILSLRLLGKLTDELSCANSRFFRTIVYADPKIADFLRGEFILHWQSVRPAPKITVDFGDGRRLERTITGNSAHYVLDYRGRVIDVLPGLYSPQAFLRELRRAAEVAESLGSADDALHNDLLGAYHRNRQAELAREISALSPRARGEVIGGAWAPTEFSADLDIPVPKGSTEWPLVRAVTPDSLPDIPAEQEPQGYEGISSIDSHILDQLVEREFQGTVFSPQSEILIRAKIASIPKEYLPNRRQAALEIVIAKLRRAVAVDTARNEYDFHRQIHDWLAVEPASDLDQLNDRVYAELFRSPNTDPWLGLLNLEAFSAIDNCGIVIEK